mmetsp:Transcript_45553/g.131977  ORF Transcript_45553/g.131977 Transcript_45553/m.131977 type:complete len:216 (-) Transcript_45553:515-1162(-)
MVPGGTCGLESGRTELDRDEQDAGANGCVRLLFEPSLVDDAVHARGHGDPPIQHRGAGIFHHLLGVCLDHVLVIPGVDHCFHHDPTQALHGNWEAADQTQDLPCQEQSFCWAEQAHLELPPAESLQPPDEGPQGKSRGLGAIATSPFRRAALGALWAVPHASAFLLPVHGLMQAGHHRGLQSWLLGALAGLRGLPLHLRQAGPEDVLYGIWLHEV